MDLSGVIFVAVAIAWAAYLIPQALKHHDEAVESRSVERFSATMRVLVRRGDAASTERVDASVSAESVAAPTPAQLRARRAAARRAMQRRRRVLGVLLALLVLGVVLAGFGAIGWGFVSAPVALLAAWLVACRVMVKGEHAAFAAARTPAVAPAAAPTAASSEAELVAQLQVPEGWAEAEVVELLDANADTGMISAVSPEPSGISVDYDELERSAGSVADPVAAPVAEPEPGSWQVRDVPLPTYVSKDHAAAPDLPDFDYDDSGVWSSGHSAADSDLVRAADEERRVEQPQRRAVGD